MNMGSEMKIYRNEADEIKKLRGWILIYGRRKVGKTFLIKNFLDYDVYFRVKRDGKILAENFVLDEINNIKDFSKAVLGLIKQNKVVIIDEFQRLPESILEEISIAHPKGKVILSGSSMKVIKRMAGRKSPLLGLTMQYKLELIKPKNILKELLKKLDPTQTIEISPYLADVWTIPFFKEEDTTMKTIYELLKYSKLTVPGLIGEIFTEEERELTIVYEAIIRLLGGGEWNYKNISRLLADRQIVKRADSSLVLPYIKNLTGMGLVEMLPIYSSKKKMYRLTSPMMEAFYYLTDRYNFEETDVSFEEVRPTIEKLRNLAIQNFIANLFAEIYKGRKEYFVTPEKEIDFIITVRRKATVVGEVKWGKYGLKDLKNFEEKTKYINAKKVFIVKKKTIPKFNNIEILDWKDLIKMI